MDGTTTPRPGSDDDVALARLRAADPAAGAAPDDARLGRLTASRRGDEAEGARSTDELAERRRQRRPGGWAAVAAVAAGAIVLGGAGFGIGRASAPPEIVADRAGTALSGTEEGERSPESMATDMSMMAPFGRTVFTASGLSTAPGTAPAWAFDAADGFIAETVARAAAVLGVEGQPVQEEGMWRVGPADGSAPSINLSSDGTLSIGYTDPALYPYFDMGVSSGSSGSDGGEPEVMPMESEAQAREDAAVAPEGVPDAGAPDSVPGNVEPAPAGTGDVAKPAPTPAEPTVAPEPAEPTPAPGPVEPPPAPMPVDPLVEPTAEPPAPAPAPEPEPGTTQAPVEAVRAVLTGLGLDAEAAEYEVQSHGDGSPVSSVVVHQVLDGTRTGLSWNADVVDGTVYSFHGPLAPVVELGTYDTVSPAQAVERLNDPRFGAVSSGMGIAVQEPAISGGWTWGEPPEAPPAAGAAVPWDVAEIAITGAEPAVMPHTTDGGATLLVPAYTLTGADGSQWTVIALADHELAF